MVIVTHTLEHLFCICVGYQRSDVSTTRVLNILCLSLFSIIIVIICREVRLLLFLIIFIAVPNMSILPYLHLYLRFILQHSIYALWNHNCVYSTYALWNHNCVYSTYALWVWSRCLKTLCILAANFRVWNKKTK